MAELTLEQKRALAIAEATKAAAESGEVNALDAMKAKAAEISNATRENSLANDLTTVGKNADAMVRGAADTVSFGLADEIAAGANTALGIGDGYEKNVAIERARDAADAEEMPTARLSGQLGGGLLQAGALVRAGLSPTAKAITAGKSLPRVMAAGTVEGGSLGALHGLGSGEGVSDRIKDAGLGTLTGALLGGATPAVISGAKAIAQPVMSYLQPEAAKDRIMAALLKRSGLAADDVAARIQAAKDDGKDMFMAADALELPGQRIMSTAARTPNDARKSVVDALMSRQMDQGRRVAADLSDAAGSRLTAEQYQQMLRAQRSADAARNYAPVMEDVTAIDVSPAVDRANRAISPLADRLANVNDAVPTDLAARAPIEAAERSIRDPIREAVREARSYLASDNLTVTNVEKAFRAKTNIDQMINKARENGQGGQVDALMPIQEALDDALARTSSQYASARDAYRTASQRVDAVDVGRDMASGRRRVEDNLSTFGALPDEEAQQAARVGYFDPKIALAASTKGKMPDAARQFTSDSMRQELPAFARPDKADQLMRRLARENTMTDTAQIALGGSKTADNMADIVDSSIDPGVLAALISGRFKDAALSAITQSANVAKGMPPSVVERLIPVLMESNPEAARRAFSASAQTMKISDDARAKIIAALLSSGSSVPSRISP